MPGIPRKKLSTSPHTPWVQPLEECLCVCVVCVEGGSRALLPSPASKLLRSNRQRMSKGISRECATFRIRNPAWTCKTSLTKWGKSHWAQRREKEGSGTGLSHRKGCSPDSTQQPAFWLRADRLPMRDRKVNTPWRGKPLPQAARASLE